MRYQKHLRLTLALVVFGLAGCNLSVDVTPDGGISGSFEILGKEFSFSLIDVGAISVTADKPAEAAVGFRLFEETPTSTPPSGVMTLPSSNVGVGQLLTSKTTQSKTLPLNGSGNIRFSVAAGQSASLCASAVLLAEYDFTYNAGVVGVLHEEYEISSQALSVLVANEVTICISITTDFDALITISGFDTSFGGTGTLSAAFTLANNDSGENIHILMPGEDFDPATNRLTPLSSRDVTIEVSSGETVTLRAGRNGTILDSATCPAVTGADYQAEASWDGATLTCTATQSGSDVDGDDPVADGTIIQVPIDNALGLAAVAPVTSTIGGIDYGVVGVLYDQTPATPFAAVELTTLSVDLTELGLDAVSTIYMAVHSSFVADLPNGVDMGTLTVSYAEGGAPTTLDFILGSNTAEWSYDRPENSPVPHSLVTTLYTFPTEIDSAFAYDGREYAVSLAVDSSRTISCITLFLPSDATYAAFRDAGSSSATFASQYVGAMTLEGPSGSPSIVGDCSGISIPTADCDADGSCDPLCDTGEDPDCDTSSQEDCSEDGVCNDACTEADPDPDCTEDCSSDGVCNDACTTVDPDPDCTEDCSSDGVCNDACTAADPDPDCVEDCSADGACNAACTATDPDPDCVEDCSADGVCNDACTAADPDPDCAEDCSADGICNENCSELDADPDCAVPDTITPACTAQSSFESGDEGWTLLGDAEGGRAEPDFNIAGGNPGAFVSADDDAAGGVWLWKAPAEYRGNFAAAYGRTLTFDLEQSSLNSQFNGRDVILTGDTGTVIWFDTPMNPGIDWTSYSILLDASAGWMLDDDSPASESVIRAVLGNIEDLQIRGEFVDGADTGGLDNVVLNSGCQ